MPLQSIGAFSLNTESHTQDAYAEAIQRTGLFSNLPLIPLIVQYIVGIHIRRDSSFLAGSSFRKALVYTQSAWRRVILNAQPNVRSFVRAPAIAAGLRILK